MTSVLGVSCLATVARVQPSAHLFRRSIRTVIVVLDRRHVGHSPLVAVPAIESVHLESPESAAAVADHDHAVGVADVHTERAVHAAVLTGTEGAARQLALA